MFFSVIVPTYNPLKLIYPLLNSIAHNYCQNEIEIILSDDCSTESLEEIPSWFDFLDIKIIKNDKHYGAPRWGRENGMNAATGQWICFADQDDYFKENAFDKIKLYLQKYKLASNYIEADLCYGFKQEDGSINEQSIDLQRNLTHAKFYEKSFLINNNIHYDKLYTGEDINFQTKVLTILADSKQPIWKFNDTLYVWMQRPGSLSKNKSGNNYIEYFYNNFADYVNGQLNIYLDRLEKNLAIDKDYYQTQIEYIIIFCYCYLSSMAHPSFGLSSLEKHYQVVKNHYQRYLQLFNTTTEDFISRIYTNIDGFNTIYKTASSQYPIVPEYSFKDWVYKYLD